MMKAGAHLRHGDMAASRGGKTMRAFCVLMGQKSLVWSYCEAGQAIEMMVGVAGFEPATPASRTQCSTGLSHTPTWNAAYSLGFR